MDMIDRMIATRQDADETQRDLANALEIHHVQIANYERRKNEPPIRYLIAFCKHYNVSADYLLGLKPGLAWPRIEVKEQGK